VQYVYASAIYRAELAGDGIKPSTLRELDIGAPWVHDTATCAEFLKCVFPALEKLAAPGRYDHGSGRMYAWNKVVKLVQERKSSASKSVEKQLLGQWGAETNDAEEAEDDDEDDYYEESAWGYSSGDEPVVGEAVKNDDWDKDRLERAMRETEDMDIT